MTTIRPRPKEEDAYQEVAESLAKELMRYANNELGDDPEEVIADLKKALDRSWRKDGYNLAKTLEDDCYWDPNADMVSTLDSAEHDIRAVLSRMTEEWIKETGSKPPAKEGDRVSARWGGNTIEGIVNRVYMNGTMNIRVEGRNGFPVVEWDTVKVIEEAPAPMKTAKQLLSELPDGYRERAIANAQVEGYDPDYTSRYAETTSHALAASFVWTLTPEGHAFWDAVDAHLRDRSKPLPPLP